MLFFRICSPLSDRITLGLWKQTSFAFQFLNSIPNFAYPLQCEIRGKEDEAKTIPLDLVFSSRITCFCEGGELNILPLPLPSLSPFPHLNSTSLFHVLYFYLHSSFVTFFIFFPFTPWGSRDTWYCVQQNPWRFVKRLTRNFIWFVQRRHLSEVSQNNKEFMQTRVFVHITWTVVSVKIVLLVCAD